jgi:hypothetical protein
MGKLLARNRGQGWPLKRTVKALALVLICCDLACQNATLTPEEQRQGFKNLYIHRSVAEVVKSIYEYHSTHHQWPSRSSEIYPTRGLLLHYYGPAVSPDGQILNNKLQRWIASLNRNTVRLAFIRLPGRWKPRYKFFIFDESIEYDFDLQHDYERRDGLELEKERWSPDLSQPIAIPSGITREGPPLPAR